MNITIVPGPVSDGLRTKIEIFFASFYARSIKVIAYANGQPASMILATRVNAPEGHFLQEGCLTVIEEIGQYYGGVAWTVDVLTMSGELVRYRPQASVAFEVVETMPIAFQNFFSVSQ